MSADDDEGVRQLAGELQRLRVEMSSEDVVWLYTNCDNVRVEGVPGGVRKVRLKAKSSEQDGMWASVEMTFTLQPETNERRVQRKRFPEAKIKAELANPRGIETAYSDTLDRVFFALRREAGVLNTIRAMAEKCAKLLDMNKVLTQSCICCSFEPETRGDPPPPPCPHFFHPQCFVQWVPASFLEPLMAALEEDADADVDKNVRCPRCESILSEEADENETLDEVIERVEALCALFQEGDADEDDDEDDDEGAEDAEDDEYGGLGPPQEEPLNLVMREQTPPMSPRVDSKRARR